MTFLFQLYLLLIIGQSTEGSESQSTIRVNDTSTVPSFMTQLDIAGT